MSLPPQDPTRPSYQQPNQQRHLFPSQQNLGQQQNVTYPRPTTTGIRGPPIQQHNSPYTTPYANKQPVPPRQNGNNGVSAEQQIAQGILSNTTNGQTPQRQPQRQNGPPPMGAAIHMTPQHTPQNQSMTVNHAVHPTPPSAMGQARDFATQQRQSQSPALQGQSLGIQRPSPMNPSPASSNLGSARPQDSPASSAQDMSMIDPQLSLDQELDPNSSLLSPADAHDENGASEVVDDEMLSAPPGGSYPTFEALFAAAQAHALSHGYAFVIGRSKRDNRGLKKVFLICDRGGTNKEKVPGEQRQRKTKSRKCGCEFGVFGLENKTAWLLRGRIDGEHLTHNHPPSMSPTEHPGARKLDPKAIAAVKALEENGVSVKETLEILHRENPTIRFLPRDIYNARAAIKRDPSRVEPTAMESLPTFYKKPPLTFEEKLRAELRTEVANAQAEVEKVKADWKREVEELKEELRQKDVVIKKFEMFIDICNERVMIRREELADVGEMNSYEHGTRNGMECGTREFYFCFISDVVIICFGMVKGG
ncbi:hypothetical protein DID88_005295 [Monilinia fructigena]|uniref:FAR1 domain-containing protein n=1 Tax=Monilinia fructigena TaxID=38457 RepID=A0A395J1Q4_9HELO|nr:hypothetical protein DID88_005295 [Monilinia fructigena]